VLSVSAQAYSRRVVASVELPRSVFAAQQSQHARLACAERGGTQLWPVPRDDPGTGRNRFCAPSALFHGNANEWSTAPGRRRIVPQPRPLRFLSVLVESPGRRWAVRGVPVVFLGVVFFSWWQGASRTAAGLMISPMIGWPVIILPRSWAGTAGVAYRALYNVAGDGRVLFARQTLLFVAFVWEAAETAGGVVTSEFDSCPCGASGSA